MFVLTNLVSHAKNNLMFEGVSHFKISPRQNLTFKDVKFGSGEKMFLNMCLKPNLKANEGYHCRFLS